MRIWLSARFWSQKCSSHNGVSGQCSCDTDKLQTLQNIADSDKPSNIADSDKPSNNADGDKPANKRSRTEDTSDVDVSPNLKRKPSLSRWFDLM